MVAAVTMATSTLGPRTRQTHPVCLGIIKEVGPVGVGLHVPELKQLPEAQQQDVLTDLRQTPTKIPKMSYEDKEMIHCSPLLK